MSKSYSPAVVADGPLIFVSGQVPEAEDGSVREGDAIAQARQVLRNLEAALEPHGADRRHIVKLTYYLRHIADLAALRSVLAEFLVHHPRPAATLVEVSGLLDSRYLLEIDAVAVLPPPSP
ncbi:RidA family protein [Nocardiopsis ansamitocini]|uniref:Endoribonuclease L-PSP n=1 Tax=Nocardiopsis ansamitocini TaxID=1670832 RepID=A0A9W6P3U2_9ACTN|nr:RidA family protein [Nocardiopsis ansamitocini]GLU46587.1 endoribonuclease L-PSP [Nocardiopsis ansamitocini]